MLASYRNVQGVPAQLNCGAADLTGCLMNFRTILILGALSAFGPLAIDFYLPAFPAMALAFGTDEKHVQLTLAAYFLGLSIGQLLYGPVADRFGRRIPLLAGVGLFTAASLACAFAPNLEWLLGARFIQALGGCAGMVISRAVVSDKCDAVGSAKVFSQLMLVMGLAPILAPMLGGLLVNTLGWQSIFLALTGFSALAALAVALGLPESMPAHMPRQPLSGALRQYARLLSDPVYLGHALTGGIAIAGMFAYIAGSPFVFIKLYGVPAEHFGWLFGINAAGFILVAQVNARLLAKRGPAFLLVRTVWVYLVAGLTLLAVSSLHTQQLWPLLIPLFICIASLGCILPNASACAMNGQGARAGSASAMLGCLQFSVAAGAASLVGVLHDGSAVPMAMVISLCGVLVVSVAMLTRRLQNARALAQAQV
ncbi:MAG: Bcr/CflA subfamily drug resistance transporter [Pseudomonas sp.]|nr:Bcr/CflA subfamily drug resistance transporter [Pseudomonas sp.]